MIEQLLKFIDNDGTERYGSIESDGFVSVNDQQGREPKGFRIKHNGDCEFNDGTFRGHIEALSGSFIGSLSGRLANGKHLYIHNSHIIYLPKTLGQLYDSLRELNIQYEENYNILCSGYVRLLRSDMSYYDIYPRYIRTNSTTNNIYLVGSMYEQNTLAPHVSHTLSSENTQKISMMELLIF